jgi:hypothetical protein
MKVASRNEEESVELRPLPRAEGRLRKETTTELTEYERAVRDLERNRTYARLTGEEVVLEPRMIGLAM